MNIGVDGESLHLATNLPSGASGTELSLARNTMKLLQSLSKENLVNFMSRNVSIAIPGGQNVDIELDEDEDVPDIDVEENLECAISGLLNDDLAIEDSTIEIIETMLGGETKANNIEKRKVQFKLL